MRSVTIPADLFERARRQARFDLAEAQQQCWLIRRSKGTSNEDYVKAVHNLREALALACLYDAEPIPVANDSAYARIPLVGALS